MADKGGSKDGRTWEEMTREKQSSEHNKFSDQQALKNLTLLKRWCEDKISELEEKKNRDEKDVQA